VRGKVTYRNKEAAQVEVGFWPKNKYAQMAQAITDAKGTFAVNVSPGTYKVTVMTLAVGSSNPIVGGGISGTAPAKGSTAVPTKYRDQQSTDIQIEVPEGGLKELNLVLKD
jgi:hypothetical protein